MAATQEYLKAHGWGYAGVANVPYEQARDQNLDVWVPACGGTEQPFRTRTGKRLLYCFNFKQNRSAYVDLDNGVVLDCKAARQVLGF